MNRQNATILTAVTALLCGCPGLFGLCVGLMMALVGVIPGSDINIGGSSNPATAIGLGLALLCLGIIFIAIPIVVGFVTLRKKPAEAVADSLPSEPLPPAS
jgi:hypothetical protein